MKQLLKIIIAFLMLSLCACQPIGRGNKDSTTKKTLVVQLLDYSKSTNNNINYFDSNACYNLVLAVSRTGGIIKPIGIYSNSSKQNVETITIPTLDTQSTTNISNLYLRVKAQDENKKKEIAFNAELQKQIGRFASIINQPHNEAYTDLQGALLLAKATLDQPNHASYTKYLLICSDMIHDVKGSNKHLTPIEFENTTILLVRPTLSEAELKKVFPNNVWHIYTDVQDAILSINNLK